LTAVYVWARWLLFFATGKDVFAGVETALANKVTTFLTSTGFAPANADYLRPVLKWGWFLLVVGFAPHQLVGMAIYILVFPITLIVFLLFREHVKNATTTSQPDARPGLARKPREMPMVSLASFLLIGWFFLYGGSVSQRPTIVGLLISAVLFLVPGYGAFQRVTPVDQTDVAIFSDLASKGTNLVVSAFTRLKDSPPKSKADAAVALRMYVWIDKIYRIPTRFLRGKRGRARVAVVVLTEYVTYLLVLGVTAILFWAFVIRIAVGAANMSLLAAFKVSSSHFLPGVHADFHGVLPWWAELFPAATAWVLFVLYVGPAASALPRNQEELVRRIGPVYREFRQITLSWAKYRHVIRRLTNRLP
jgi:hypothetical protein